MASSAADEAGFLARLQAGEEAAYEQLVRGEGPRMLAVARHLLRHEEEARDAVQDAFLAAFRALPRFRGEARLATWLHRILVNACLMRLRSRPAEGEEQEIEELLPQFLPDGHEAAPSRPWSIAGEGAGLEVVVRDAVERLPPSYRTVLLLRDIEGLSTEEAAAALGVSPGAVKVRLHRARQALRTLLDPRMHGEAA